MINELSYNTDGDAVYAFKDNGCEIKISTITKGSSFKYIKVMRYGTLAVSYTLGNNISALIAASKADCEEKGLNVDFSIIEKLLLSKPLFITPIWISSITE